MNQKEKQTCEIEHGIGFGWLNVGNVWTAVRRDLIMAVKRKV